MRYRALTWDKAKKEYRYVYGLPSYGFETEEIEEIGTPNGDFYEINPETLGKETEYRDCSGKKMFTGDITTLEVDREVREFEVVETTTDREYNTLPGFDKETVKVRLQGVIAFKWNTEGKEYFLLPCINKAGVCDTVRMKIIDTVHERAVRGSEGKSKN